MIKRYSYPTRAFQIDFEPVSSPVYDKIVDKTDFRPDSEQTRSVLSNLGTNSSENLKYDYQDGKVPKDDPVTDLILDLRNGKLDKADVQKIREQLDKAAENEAKSSADKKALEAEKNASKARYDALDEALGVNQS